MDSNAFVQELVASVAVFAHSLDANPPAYSYIPLTTNEQRVMVMKSRLHNEQRAANMFGTWLRTTPEFEVKTMMARSAHEEMTHAGILAERIRGIGQDPFDYKPLPAQTAMFNAVEGLTDTCQRIAGFSMAGEAVATHLTRLSLDARSVPDWIKNPYKRITDDEERHGSAPQNILEQYAVGDEVQDAARRAVAMRLVLFREYLASLDRWVIEGAPW
jgi:rubrerythrin